MRFFPIFLLLLFLLLVYFGVVSNCIWILSNLRELKISSKPTLIKEILGELAYNTYLSGGGGMPATSH